MATPSTSTSPAVIGPASAKNCSNCGQCGHTVSTCFSPGGGMEGQRDMYKKDKGKVVAMLLASLDDTFALSDEKLQIPDNTFIDPNPPTLNDNLIIPHMSFSSVHEHNQNINRDLYPF